MSIFAIGDLHLSGAVHKPMTVFGSHWQNHWEKIKKNWKENVTGEDAVLIAGDISWAMTLEEALVDLKEIHLLPGKKIFIKGNHDYWWKTITKLNQIFEDQFFIQNNFYIYQDYIICGTRGWICPNSIKFTEHDKKIYERELKRLILSLEEVKKIKGKQIIVLTHFPPTNDQLDSSGFTELYEEYSVSKVIYGHLHGENTFSQGLQGIYNNVKYYLVSADYMNFNLQKIL